MLHMIALPCPNSPEASCLLHLIFEKQISKFFLYFSYGKSSKNITMVFASLLVSQLNNSNQAYLHWLILILWASIKKSANS